MRRILLACTAALLLPIAACAQTPSAKSPPISTTPFELIGGYDHRFALQGAEDRDAAWHRRQA